MGTSVGVIWLILGLVLLWVMVVAFFTSGTHFMIVYKRDGLSWGGSFLNRAWILTGYVILLAALVLDFLFNMTWGSLLFRERPRARLFTQRLHWHKSNSKGWRLEKAKEWCDTLNRFDDGHC